MITRSSMGGEDVNDVPPIVGADITGPGLARVTRGPRVNELVNIVSEADGMTTAVWTDQKGQVHRFKAESTMFQKIAPRKRTHRARKKKAKKTK